MPGVALGQSAQGHIASFYYSVYSNGILGISGTTGIKPAVVAQKRAQAGFVAGDKKNKQATH
jgi:hypothetical protein